MRYPLLFWLVLFCHNIYGQSHRFQQYRVEHGLPSDVIKDVSRDDLGFVWIATDDGLVKYDGIRFTTYKSALNSQFAKGFIRTKDNRLLVVADMDLLEVINKVDTVVFISLIRGTRNPTDSTISFPRTFYEDKRGEIWMGEPQAIVRYDGKGIKRYRFENKYASTVFIRSFSFFENDAHELFAITYEGVVFYYDREKDSFTLTGSVLPGPISDVLYFDHALWLASFQGVFVAQSTGRAISDLEKRFEISEVSDLELNADSTQLWVSTYNEKVHLLQRDEKLWNVTTMPFQFSDVNRSYVDPNGLVWCATDKGVILIQEKMFLLPQDQSSSHYIESIAFDEFDSVLYYCAKEFLYALDYKTDKGTIAYSDRSGYFQSLQVNRHGLWAANRTSILLFKKGKLYRTWDFSNEGNFISDIYADKLNNLWISQSGNDKALVINDELEVQRYNVPFTGDNSINLIRAADDGIYLGSNGIRNYLFFKPTGGAFTNVSIEPPFTVDGDFNVNGLVVQQNRIWIASTVGLLTLEGEVLRRVDIGEKFSREPVASIRKFDTTTILFSNSFGLFRFDVNTGEFWLYDENTGLPSNTIPDQGIFVDPFQKVWIGTSYGLAYTDRFINTEEKTPTVYCIETKINGQTRKLSQQHRVPYDAFIDLHFTSITFPEKVDFHWRMNDDSVWHRMEKGVLSLNNLHSGNYKLQVRGKGMSKSWSDTTTVSFSVAKPYWQTAGFIFAVIILIGIIAWISYMISAHIMEKRKGLLQNLVNSRTYELQQVNEELRLRNTELDRFVYSASHDLSAPLKSLMGLINVARMERPGNTHDQYLKMMERSVLKLDQFIREVVSYSRNSRMPLKLERFNFATLVENVLQDFQYSPNFISIQFVINDDTDSQMVCDITRLKIILNNLISNAINFQRSEKNVKPFVKIHLTMHDGHYVITVEDNGRGIGKEHVDKIFDMFYRASEDSQGSGLGLYILKESVTKLDGSISVTSVLHEGTTFKIRLPVPLMANVSRPSDAYVA
ncbi:MAG TPA: ATP-binding protein [Chryseosolibacter sp.]|nr:ATP-binding protein [Chryseosolibacter sp.]